MRMISPQVDAPQITIAEEQEQYKPLTAALLRNAAYGSRRADGINTVLLCFRPSAEERARLAAGDDVYVSLLTFGDPMSPIIVSCGKDETAAIYGVPVAT